MHSTGYAAKTTPAAKPAPIIVHNNVHWSCAAMHPSGVILQQASHANAMTTPISHHLPCTLHPAPCRPLWSQPRTPAPNPTSAAPFRPNPRGANPLAVAACMRQLVLQLPDQFCLRSGLLLQLVVTVF